MVPGVVGEAEVEGLEEEEEEEEDGRLENLVVFKSPKPLLCVFLSIF